MACCSRVLYLTQLDFCSSYLHQFVGVGYARANEQVDTQGNIRCPSRHFTRRRDVFTHEYRVVKRSCTMFTSDVHGLAFDVTRTTDSFLESTQAPEKFVPKAP